MRAYFRFRKFLIPLFCVIVALALWSISPAQATSATVTVSGTQWGVSTCYIGATEGNVRFDINDLIGAGITTYRIYGGMSRWEATDDSSTYGFPDIPTIKSNPNSINWAWWDNIMTNPPNGSDYWWSGTVPNIWQGNARTIFSGLQSAGIRPVLTIRNHDNFGNPGWAPNPPVTQLDWNEWWEHVFATAYWLNVRNNYHVDDYEVHNEPDNAGQGWGGTQAQYEQLIQQTKDAINYVYTTYLPGRTYHIYAPVTQNTSNWPLPVLQNAGASFDSVDVHDYQSTITSYVQQVHGWMNSTGYGSDPLWLSEWATYRGGYQNASTGVSLLINNLILMSEPGQYVYGSHMFSMYGWNSGGKNNFQGLVDINGNKVSSYYALQMATKALNGCKPTYQSTANNGNLMALTTKDSSGTISLLVTNTNSSAITVDADLSSLLTSGTGTMYQYDSTHNDVVVGNPALSAGHVSFTAPGSGAILIQFGGGNPPPTNTPVPPTNTPTNTPTSTPTPQSTVQPPTNTPSGPTNTPVPATNTPTSTPTPLPTNTPAGTVMHIAQLYTTDINGNPQSTFTRGNPVYFQAQVVDQNSNPVTGATVTTSVIRPDGSTWSTPSAATDSSGWAKFKLGTVHNSQTGLYTVNVTNVTLNGATYNPSANVISSTTFTLN